MPGICRSGPFAIVATVVLLLFGCSSAPYRYTPLEELQLTQRALSQVSGAFAIKAAVPSAEEARQLFGVPVYERGIQPVWLEIANHSSADARFIISSLDAEYFSPFEVAYIHRKQFSKQGWQDMERHLYGLSLPRQIPAGRVVSGFVFTHASPGTKAFNADVFYGKEPPEFEHFTFFVPVPGFVPDHAEIDFRKLYPEAERREVDEQGLRKLLHELPCCSTDRSGHGQGKPVNIVLVAPGQELLQALLRSGWSETSYERSEEYLNASDYLFGRPPDGIFRKLRDKSTERAELAIWLSPVLADGDPVWMVQLRHAIGRRFRIGDYFFGSKLDPNVDDGRNYLLQDFWYAQALEAYAFSLSGAKIAQDQPVMDFRGDPFFSDGFRFVLWISGNSVALTDTRGLPWDLIGGR